jgi:hypothetical protein
MKRKENIPVIPLKLYLHEHQLLWHYNKHLSVTIRRIQTKEDNAPKTHGIREITACEAMMRSLSALRLFTASGLISWI